jgi:hypothetical protein
VSDQVIIVIATLIFMFLCLIVERIYNGWNHYVEHRWPGEHDTNETS